MALSARRVPPGLYDTVPFQNGPLPRTKPIRRFEASGEWYPPAREGAVRSNGGSCHGTRPGEVWQGERPAVEALDPAALTRLAEIVTN